MVKFPPSLFRRHVLFIVLLQVRKVNSLNMKQILIVQLNASKFVTYWKNSLYALATIWRKTIVFTLREQDVTAEKVGGNLTTHVQRRIIEICITYTANYSSEMHKNEYTLSGRNNSKIY